MKNLLRNLAYSSVIVAATTVTVCQLNRPVQATPPGRVIVGTYSGGIGQGGGDCSVMLDNGDVYYTRFGSPGSTAVFIGNFWGDQPINVSPSTWSGIKTKLGTPSGN